MEENIVENANQNNKNNENNDNNNNNDNDNNSLVKKKEGIKNELTIFTVNMLNLYSQNERSGNPDEDITMHKIKTRHLLIYYLYRVFCKYRDTIMNVISTEEINNLYKLLNIPENSKGCMPMAGRMSNKKEQLDTTLFTLIKVLNDFNIGHKRMVAEDKFNEMMEFFKSKENPKKILEDIKVLNILIPNLSTTNIEYNVFDKGDKKTALIDLGIEPYNDDVSLGASPETTTTMDSNTGLNNSESNNNKLEKELENEEEREFDASEVAIQNSSLPPQNKLPEVASLGNMNEDITDIKMDKDSPSPPVSSQSPIESSPIESSPIESSPTESSSTESSSTESSPIESSSIESSPTELSPTESSPTESSPTESSPPPASLGNELKNNNNSLFKNESSANNELNKL